MEQGPRRRPSQVLSPPQSRSPSSVFGSPQSSPPIELSAPPAAAPHPESPRAAAAAPVASVSAALPQRMPSFIQPADVPPAVIAQPQGAAAPAVAPSVTAVTPSVTAAAPSASAAQLQAAQADYASVRTYQGPQPTSYGGKAALEAFNILTKRELFDAWWISGASLYMDIILKLKEIIEKDSKEDLNSNLQQLRALYKKYVGSHSNPWTSIGKARLEAVRKIPEIFTRERPASVAPMPADSGTTSATATVAAGAPSAPVAVAPAAPAPQQTASPAPQRSRAATVDLLPPPPLYTPTPQRWASFLALSPLPSPPLYTSPQQADATPSASAVSQSQEAAAAARSPRFDDSSSRRNVELGGTKESRLETIERAYDEFARLFSSGQSQNFGDSKLLGEITAKLYELFQSEQENEATAPLIKKYIELRTLCEMHMRTASYDAVAFHGRAIREVFSFCNNIILPASL